MESLDDVSIWFSGAFSCRELLKMMATEQHATAVMVRIEMNAVILAFDVFM